MASDDFYAPVFKMDLAGDLGLDTGMDGFALVDGDDDVEVRAEGGASEVEIARAVVTVDTTVLVT